MAGISFMHPFYPNHRKRKRDNALLDFPFLVFFYGCYLFARSRARISRTFARARRVMLTSQRLLGIDVLRASSPRAFMHSCSIFSFGSSGGFLANIPPSCVYVFFSIRSVFPIISLAACISYSNQASRSPAISRPLISHCTTTTPSEFAGSTGCCLFQK